MLQTHRSRPADPERVRAPREQDLPAAFDPLAAGRPADHAAIDHTVYRAANRDLIVAGERHAEVYIVRDGWLLRSRLLHSGRRQIVDFVLPGDIVGLEACLFGRSLYAITTITPVSLSVMSLDRLEQMSARSPAFSKALLWSAVCRGAVLGEHLVDAARRTAYERVSHLLLELFMRLRRAGRAKELSFDLPLTQRHIGDALGLTTVHVNRTLRALRDDGLIRLADRRATILDVAALMQLSDFERLYLGDDAPAATDRPTPSAFSGKDAAAARAFSPAAPAARNHS
jgi:CRP-like cAMP-binding protein